MTDKNECEFDSESEIDWIKSNVGEDLRSGKMTIGELRDRVLGLDRGCNFNISESMKDKKKYEEVIRILNESDDF